MIVQTCPECGQLFEYGVWLKDLELCSVECRGERALGEAEQQREWQRDELALQSLEDDD